MSDARGTGQARRSAAPAKATSDLDLLRQRSGENLIAPRAAAPRSPESASPSARGLHKSEVELLERCLRLPSWARSSGSQAPSKLSPCELVAGMAWRPGSTTGQPAPGARRGRFELDSLA